MYLRQTIVLQKSQNTITLMFSRATKTKTGIVANKTNGIEVTKKNKD
jgi:hypothetical protein